MDLKVLADHGVSAEAWKKLLDKEIPKTPEGTEASTDEQKRSKLINRIRGRIQEGQNYNFKNFSILHQMDLLWDTPFDRTSQASIESILKDPEIQTRDALVAALKGGGHDLDSVVRATGETDPKSGLPVSELSVANFKRVTLPFVRAYLTVRKAKLLNDRNKDPLFQYKPIINTAKNRAKCQVATNRSQLMNTQYNYVTALDQALFQMLLYPTGGLMFTYEDWHVETQKRYKTTTAEEAVSTEEKPKKKKTKKEKKRKKEDGSKFDSDDYEDYVVREGLRQHLPHPSRCYIDRAYSPRSINTDTGCRYGGFWKVVSYGEILDAGEYWNTDRIKASSDSWWTDNSAFFSSVYNTCVLNYGTSVTTGGVKNRESDQLGRTYGASERDKSVVLVEHREKVIPKDDGLGDYPYPIWARFVFAGDGTVVYAQPLGYVPMTCWKDNGDDKRTEDATLALTLSGFQDTISNLLTQHIISVRQNLTNITLVDENIFDKNKRAGILDKLRNLGEKLYTRLNIFPVDGKQLKVSQNNVAQAFYSHKFPTMNTGEIIQAIKVVLDMAERMLQFSSQEVAQQATHEQTREEIRGLQGSTTNILEYTGMPVDQGMAAMGKQIYDAWMQYGEDDFATGIPSDALLTDKMLEEMGFVLDEGVRSTNDHIIVRANKSAIEMPLFAVIPANRDRVSNPDAARVMAEFVRDVMNNPQMAMALGPDQAIDLANQIAKLSGIPLNKELRNLTQQQSQDILQQVIQQILPMVKDGMVPVLEKMQSTDQKVTALYQQLGLPVPQETNGNNTNGAANPGPGANSPGMAQPAGGTPLPPAPPLPSGVVTA